MSTKDQFTTKWPEIQSKVQQKWNKLTQDELKSTHGDFEKVVTLIQKKYGISREQVINELETFGGRETASVGASHKNESHQNAGNNERSQTTGGQNTRTQGTTRTNEQSQQGHQQGNARSPQQPQGNQPGNARTQQPHGNQQGQQGQQGNNRGQTPGNTPNRNK